MTPTRTHAWAAAAVVIGGALLWVQIDSRNRSERASEHRPRETTQPRGSGHAGALALRREIAQLRAEVDDLRRAQRAETRDGDVNAVRARSAEPRVDPYRDLDPVERDGAIAGDLYASMASEPVDESWRAEAEAIFKAALTDIDTADVIALECRSTLCRVELSHAGSEERIAAADAFTAQIPWEASGFVHMIPSEPPTSVIYVARAGHSLPSALR